MENKCDWCKKEVEEITVYEVLGVDYEICGKCLKAKEEDLCITCLEPLYGQMTMNGECSGCQQIREAKSEKRRGEIMNGLGVDVLAELTHSVVFTEEDYERWVTFGQGNFTPEKRKQYRRNWIRNKLISECKWEEDIFDENVADIEYLLDNYSHKIFNKSCTFMINNKETKGLRGVNIIERKGNVMIIEKE